MAERLLLFDESRWTGPCGSRLTISIHSQVSFAHETFPYSRPKDSTVYASPIMALSRNASMIHTVIVIACHLLSGCGCVGLLATHDGKHFSQRTQNGYEYERSYDHD